MERVELGDLLLIAEIHTDKRPRPVRQRGRASLSDCTLVNVAKLEFVSVLRQRWRGLLELVGSIDVTRSGCR